MKKTYVLIIVAVLFLGLTIPKEENNKNNENYIELHITHNHLAKSYTAHIYNNSTEIEKIRRNNEGKKFKSPMTILNLVTNRGYKVISSEIEYSKLDIILVRHYLLEKIN